MATGGYNGKEVSQMAMDRPRYSITLDQELFQRVEDFRFENRYQTRNEATVQLIRLGLEQIDRQRLNQEDARARKGQAE